MPVFQDAFISYARKDSKAFAERLKRRLEQDDLVIWLDQEDIPPITPWRDRIREGIETAHNFIYVVSPGAVASEYCQIELDLALSLNKRIVPLLHVSTPSSTVPAAVRDIQWIPFQDNLDDFETAIQVLRAALQEDSGYLHQHTALLTQALKWERNQRRAAMLLRGHNLRYAENWLKIAQARTLQRPTDLQAEFIAISREQPPAPALDVFISYSQKDAADFARGLNAELQLQGQHIWFDQESIAPEVDFQQEIYQGIEGSDVFLFVLSPEAVNSPHCADEVNYASGLNKRIVTVLYRQVNTVNLHPVLRNLQWLDFSGGEFSDNFQRLLTTLNDNPQHLQLHTRLLVRAGEWDRRGRDESLLLRGQDLQTAEAWLEDYAEIEPKATGLQQEYIRAGRAKQEAEAAAEKKLRRGALIGTVAAVAGILVAVGSGLVALKIVNWASKEVAQAQTQLDNATQQTTEAEFNEQQAVAAAEAAAQQTQRAEREQQQAEAAAEEAAAAQQTAETRAREADNKAQTAAVAQQRAEASAQAADAKAQDAETRATEADIKARNAETQAATAEKAQRLAQTVTQLEQSGTAALNRANFDQIGALLRALKASRGLEEIVQENNLIINRYAYYPTTSPIVAMQQIQDVINHIPNQLFSHKLRVNSASFSSDGSQLVTASSDSTARVWNLQTGSSILLKGHEDNVTSARFNSLGNQVVTASWDGTARIWNLQTNSSKLLTGHNSWVYDASFSPDGSQVVTASADYTARIWDVETGEYIPLEGHTNRVNSASFSSDGGQAITASADHTARVWNTETGTHIITLKGHTGNVNIASFSHDDSQIMTASDDGTARVWNVEAGEYILLNVLKGHTNRVNSASFSPDGSQLVTASSDSTARVWNLQTGSSIPLEGHESHVTSARFNSSGNRVITASLDGTARVWNLNSLTSIVLKGHGEIVESAYFNRTDDQAVTASSDGTARVWNLKSNLSNDEGSSTPNSEGQQLVITSAEGIARIWTLNSDFTFPEVDNSHLLESRWRVVSQQIAGNRLISTLDNGILQVFDINTRISTPLENREGRLSLPSFDTNGSQVVASLSDGKAAVWNLETGNSTILEGHSSAIFSSSFNAGGDHIVTGSNDTTARVWNSQTGENIATLREHNGAILSVSFNALGNQVVSASTDKTAQVWNWKTDNSIVLKGHEGAVFVAKFSPDGNRVVTASWDGTARIWNWQTGDFVVIEGYGGKFDSITFNATGTQVIATLDDDTTRVFDLQGKQLAIFEGSLTALSNDGLQVATNQNGRVKINTINTLPELLAWGCQWLHNYLEYGQATDGDRALCNLPPRDSAPAGPFESSLGRTLVQAQVSWPEQG